MEIPLFFYSFVPSVKIINNNRLSATACAPRCHHLPKITPIMISIPVAVEEVIKKKPFLEGALVDGLINLSALARQIKPEVEERIGKKPRVVYLSPQGKTFHQEMAEEFAKEEELVFLCGHYEGIDERVLEEIVTDYVSIGDYVLTGGELPAMIMVDAISRLVPGVLHNDVSAEFESFQDHLLEYPQYSRPEVWHDKRVPEVLMSGHHANIEKWRREQSVIRTAKNRPDLLLKAELTEEEKRLAEEISGCKAGDMGL